MHRTILAPLAPLALVALLASSAAADVIYLIDGSSIGDVKIVSETLKEVAYREEGKSSNKTIDPDSILSIDYSKKPERVDAGELALADGDLSLAAEELELYVNGIIEGQAKERKYPWAPAYAMHKLMDLYLSGGNFEGVVTAADNLVKNAPDSRHLPSAYLAKAEAQRLMGKAPTALATLEELRALIQGKGLSPRWQLELELSEALTKPDLKGQAKRDRLIEIASKAGTRYPTVRNRARVAEGESYLEGASKDFAKAREVFEKIAADPKADRATLAGAYTGLGDCLFQQAVDENKAGKAPGPNLDAALENYMRVVVVYKEQQRYVAKAMFYAGRAFEFKGDDASKERARLLYRRVVQRYGDSPWGSEARRQLGA